MGLTARLFSRTHRCHRTRVRPYMRVPQGLLYRWDCQYGECGHHGWGYSLPWVHNGAHEHAAKHHPRRAAA